METEEPLGGSLGPASAKFVDEPCEQVANPRELRQLIEVVANVAQRSGDVLDVNRVAPSGGLISKRAERLEVALQRHYVEPLPKPALFAGAAAERQEIRQ